MKKVIINADDFGLSKSINKGIIECYKRGILTSASLIVNAPGFEDAIDLIKRNLGLSTGIHINVIRGKAVLPADKVKYISQNGLFLGNMFRILKISYLHKRQLKELEMEFRAQIERALDSGINITHIDSEKHIHMIGPIFEIISRIAIEYGIPRIRYVKEAPIDPGNMHNLYYLFKKQFYKILLFNLVSIKKRSLGYKFPIKITDYFYGLYNSGSLTTEKYERIFMGIKNGTTEIMCHPGYIDEEWKKYPLSLEKFYLNQNRERELNALIDPKVKELVYKLGIKLVGDTGF